MPYKDPNSEQAKESQRRRALRWYEKNKEKYLENEKNNPIRKKALTINNWKRRGIIGDYDKLYEKYLNCNECELCNNPFKSSYYRCLDHDHDTGEFRNILCRACNNRR